MKYPKNKIDIKKLFEKLDLKKVLFRHSSAYSREILEILKTSKSVLEFNEYEKQFRTESAHYLANYILDEKDDLIEKKEDSHLEDIEYRTELYIFSKDEFKKIITEIENYIDEYYERKIF